MTSSRNLLTVCGRIALVATLAGSAASAFAQAPGGGSAATAIRVDVGRPGARISPTLFGVFFEDINFAADGGLYPERVINRSFEFPEPLAGWRKPWRPASDGELIVLSDGALSGSNPHYLRLRAYTPGPEGFGVVNAGFRGMGVEAGAEYVFSAWVRAKAGGPRALSIRLRGERGDDLGEATLGGFGAEWKRFETTLRPTGTEARAQLEIAVTEPGEIDLDRLSLFPRETWKGRPNGLRQDLVQLLADLQPGFLRFPGGCIVEGRRLELRYDWKKTLGAPDEREILVNRWNDEFSHRPTPDYYQSFGLGFFEYFQLAEDLGAMPLPIVNCGMACQFNSGETAPMRELDPFVQDALDLIAFANGPVESRWGRLRAAMGHPAPFGLKVIGIGNEQWGPRYVERYERFAEVLKREHPDVELVASSGGPFPESPMFEYLWKDMRRLRADYVDEHYYMDPEWFLSNAGRYDDYDREGPRVFASEYAAQTAGIARPNNRNNWEAALAEAAFITGLERNADVVAMSSYAPLFAHVDAWQWTPNLIWFDNLRSCGTPSYYVQKTYANHQGTHVLPVSVDAAAQGPDTGLYTSASIHAPSSELILKLVNTSADERPVVVDVAGARELRGGRRIVLGSADLEAENSLEDPTRISPVESTVVVQGSGFELRLAPRSLTVLRAGYSK